MRLYKVDPKGKIRVWDITKEVDCLVIFFGVDGGVLNQDVVYVKVNKSGRTLAQQLELEYQSRISKQLDKGYVMSRVEALKTQGTNLMRLPKPMLARPFQGWKRDPGDVYMQYKYDGMRCLIHNKGGVLTAYSRNGKPITTIEHILEKISIPEGETLDGELYCHNTPLQSIVSWTKRLQPNTWQLGYHVYDCVAPVPFSERLALLREWGQPYVPTTLFHRENLDRAFAQARLEGYEGLILRPDGLPYEPGKRSASLYKVKKVEDGYFLIRDIKPSSKDMAILDCGTFTVTAPGTHSEKKKILENKEEYIGKLVRVEYANLTPEGVPFHPIATLIEA